MDVINHLTALILCAISRTTARKKKKETKMIRLESMNLVVSRAVGTNSEIRILKKNI